MLHASLKTIPKGCAVIEGLIEEADSAKDATGPSSFPGDQLGGAVEHAVDVPGRDDYQAVGVTDHPVTRTHRDKPNFKGNSGLPWRPEASTLWRSAPSEHLDWPTSEELHISYIAVGNETDDSSTDCFGPGKLTKIGPVTTTLDHEDIPGAAFFQAAYDTRDRPLLAPGCAYWTKKNTLA